MQNATSLVGGKLMGGPLGGRSNDIVLLVQDQNGILLHHVRLGHGVAIPCCRHCRFECLGSSVCVPEMTNNAKSCDDCYNMTIQPLRLVHESSLGYVEHVPVRSGLARNSLDSVMRPASEDDCFIRST